MRASRVRRREGLGYEGGPRGCEPAGSEYCPLPALNLVHVGRSHCGLIFAYMCPWEGRLVK